MYQQRVILIFVFKHYILTSKMKYFTYLLLLLLSLFSFYACNDDEKFSTSSSLRLEFSSDTIRFDTVFTSIGSATKRLKVYNRNGDALTLSNVDLVSGGKKGFRINVDGIAANSVSNIDILARDSMFVFVEVNIDPLDQNNSLLITDSIRFQFNGVTQYVSLEAIGQDVVLWKGKTISKDTTLTAQKPYLIYDNLTIQKGAVLNLKEGVGLYFHGGSGLYVNGQINAVGTIEKPVLMRGDRTDNLFDSPKVPYDRVHGQWSGVHVAADSYQNKFENVRIRNAVYGILFYQSTPDQTKASILNTIIQNTSKEGILSINNKLSVANSLIANAGTSAVRIIGGDNTFVQNTIANYMSSYWGFLRDAALIVSNTGLNDKSESVSFPLASALFANTIVSGSSSSELKLQFSDNYSSNYKFINCLIRNKGEDDTHFQNIVWGEDPKFAFIYSQESVKDNPDNYYYYNFELTADSPARRKGARTYAADYPFDIRGISRIGTEAPDIGCYQYVGN